MYKELKHLIKKYFGAIIFLSVISIQGLANLIIGPKFHQIYEFIFGSIRSVYDSTLGRLPFASIYILLIFVGILLYQLFRSTSYHKSQFGIKVSICYLMLKIINFVLLCVGLFYLLWGYNYHREGILSTQKWQEIEVDSTKLIQELNAVSLKLNDFHTNKLLTPENSMLWVDIENVIRESETKLLLRWNYPIPGNVRVRPLYPKGILLRISTAGFYNPFSFEGHVDPGLNRIQWPFTIAHEMAHGYGFTDEGECNFIALVSCITSNNLEIQYSGWISYWRYLYYDVKSRFPYFAEKHFKTLHPNIIEDLKAIRNDSQKYPDLFPFVRDFIYDFYLKMHGMKDGLHSYNEISKLMISYQVAKSKK